MLKFDEIISVNGNKLTKHYIQSLCENDRLKLIDPIFDQLRDNGFIYPDDEASIIKSWEKVKTYQPDLTAKSIYNNSSLGTNICKYFCHTFYDATETDKPTMIEIFNDDIKLKRIITI